MPTKTKHILCLNSGSSSLKFALFEMGANKEKLLMRGAVERIGLPDAACPDHAAAVDEAFRQISKYPQPQAVGHRIVHGGATYTKPARIDAKLIAELKNLVRFAPLHMPSEILCIESVARRFPKLMQVACFDTAFHSKIPEVAKRFALPHKFWDKGIRRYGFHGLSYEYIMDVIGPKPPSKIIIAHLGNGASMAAIKNGKCIDTTMGFTPAGGFMMGTRPGDLDPGILIHLMREEKLSANELDDIINNKSGLFGVSELSPDMKTLLENRRTNKKAALAIEMFCYQARKTIGSLAAALGGLDLLVFTAGIGERAALVRLEICNGLKRLGIVIDKKKNAKNADIISSSKSKYLVRMIPTNEDIMIASHTAKFIV